MSEQPVDIPIDQEARNAPPYDAIPPLDEPETSTHIIARSLQHPGHFTALEPLGRDKLFAGGIEPKAVVTATVGDRAVSLIERPYSGRVVRVWQALRDASVPVPPTLRTMETKQGHQRLLFTDLKADGSEFYGKGLRLVLQKGTKHKHDTERERAPEIEVDRRFLELSHPDNLPMIKERAEKYAQRASAHGIVLPSDDTFELYVRPDGSWDLVVLDLTWADVRDSSLDPNIQAMTDEDVATFNSSRAEASIKNISQLHEKFKPLLQKRSLGKLILDRIVQKVKRR